MEVNNMLYLEKFEHGGEMKKYGNVQKFEALTNYGSVQHTSNGKFELAKYIHNKYDSMDENEMKCIAMKCLDISDIKKILLKYEFDFYVRKPQVLTLDEFVKEVCKMLHLYQGKAGGWLLEDDVWIVHRHNSKFHEVGVNEVLFENTVALCDVDNEELTEYLYNLTDKLSSIVSNIDVELRYKEIKKIMHVLIWANVKEDNVIGL